MEASTPVKRYNLPPPSEQDVVTSLARLVGADQAQLLWSTARVQAGIRSGGALLSLAQLDAALQQLKLVKGMASVAANSLLVRVKSFRTLSAMHSK